jgi:hypothetical protein
VILRKRADVRCENYMKCAILRMLHEVIGRMKTCRMKTCRMKTCRMKTCRMKTCRMKTDSCFFSKFNIRLTKVELLRFDY